MAGYFNIKNSTSIFQLLFAGPFYPTSVITLTYLTLLSKRMKCTLRRLMDLEMVPNKENLVDKRYSALHVINSFPKLVTPTTCIFDAFCSISEKKQNHFRYRYQHSCANWLPFSYKIVHKSVLLTHYPLNCECEHSIETNRLASRLPSLTYNKNSPLIPTKPCHRSMPAQ